MSSPKFLASKHLFLSFAISLTGLASAAPTTFFGSDATPGSAVPAEGQSRTKRTAFETMLTTRATENFEASSFVFGEPSPTSSAPKPVLGGHGTMFRNDLALGITRIENRTIIENSVTGRFNTSPAPAAKWWETSASFTLTLSSTAQAFGFYGTDFGDFAGTLTIDRFNGNSVVGSRITVPRGSAGNGSLLFFGFVDSEIDFNRVVFNLEQLTPEILNSYDIVGFDDLIVGTVDGTTNPPAGVPEPGTLALAMLSLGLLAAARRRQG